MDFFKKLIFSIFLATAMVGTSSVSMAAGKIENATTEDVKKAIDDSINYTNEALSTLNAGGDKEAIMALIKKAAQAAKRIESNRLDVLRNRTTARLKKARFAVKRDQPEDAANLLGEALKGFQEIKAQF